jgi:hypothetical protein
MIDRRDCTFAREEEKPPSGISDNFIAGILIGAENAGGGGGGRGEGNGKEEPVTPCISFMPPPR